MRRKTTETERSEFVEAFKEARPHHPVALPSSKKPAKKPGRTGGLDGNTQDRLRAGKLEPEARIDLHGMTETAAHRALLGFLRNAHRMQARLVLVITGKGAKAVDPHAPFDMEQEGRARGVLKQAVPRWLQEPAFAGLIADTRASHTRHGGGGALYIYLRKKRD